MQTGLLPEARVWSPRGCQPRDSWGHMVMEREHMSAQASECHWARALLCSLELCYLGLQKHQEFFFRITNQLPKLSQASDASTPLPLISFPGQASMVSMTIWQASMLKHQVCAILTSVVPVLTCSCPPTNQFQKGKGRVLILGGTTLWSPAVYEVVVSWLNKKVILLSPLGSTVFHSLASFFLSISW